MSEEKTESPTDKKLDDAREQGMVAKSQDIADAASLLAVVVVLVAAQSWMTGHLGRIVRQSLDFVQGPHDDTSLLAAMWLIVRSAFLVVLPMVMAAAVAATLALACQVGLRPTFKPITPSLGNVDPVAGLKRMFSLRSLLELLKSIIKALVFGWIGGQVLFWLLPISLGALYQPARELAHLAWQACLRLLEFWLAVYAVVGVADWFLQRMVFLRGQRMSKDEVKREYRDDEGDPIIKGERRKQQRSLGESGAPNPKTAMRQATALVTNPTHYAVALRYAPAENPLPIVLVSGMDEKAAMLRELAGELEVPMVANPPLARALYAVEPGHPIPEPLFEAVAAVLRWVLAMQQPGEARGDIAPPV